MTSWFERSPAVCLGKQTRSILQKHPLVLADVGAAMGVDTRWNAIRQWLQVLLFEPDERSELRDSPGVKVYRFALGSEKTQQRLKLTSLPAASSFYPISPTLQRFVVKDWVSLVAGQGDGELINVERLDQLDAPAPDFIKLDVEGSELDVLQGAGQVLPEHVLAVQVEVSLTQRFEQAPDFSQIDEFLRKNGFRLHQIATERWRRQRQEGEIEPPDVGSSYQAVWADVLYLREDSELLTRIRSGENGEAVLCKLIALSQVYRAYDYALDLVSQLPESELVNEIKSELRHALKIEYGRFWCDAILALLVLPCWLAGQVFPVCRGHRHEKIGMLLSLVLQRLTHVTGRRGPEKGIVSELL